MWASRWELRVVRSTKSPPRQSARAAASRQQHHWPRNRNSRQYWENRSAVQSGAGIGSASAVAGLGGSLYWADTAGNTASRNPYLWHLYRRTGTTDNHRSVSSGGWECPV